MTDAMTEMIRYRWTSFGPMLDEDGPFVTYADHVEALRQADQRAYDNGVNDMRPWSDDAQRQWDKGYEQGQRDALAAVLSDINARLQREIVEGDVDGLRDGLLYFVEVLERQIKGEQP